MNLPSDTFTAHQAADYIGLSYATMRLWRAKGKGPRYFRAGDRLIRYRRSDLDAWIEARLSDKKAKTKAKAARRTA